GQKPLNNQSLETKNPKNTKSLDSNSKINKTLESKNPNKIQTTKIQDSKIQLESNPKDFAKLESQKISKIELESKKIQRAKSTLDFTTKKAKESSKTKSFVRIIPTSIALASALSSNVAAAPSDLPSGVNQKFDNVVLEEASGYNPKVTVSGTISNGTITSGTAIVSGGNIGSSRRQSADSPYTGGDLVRGDGGATSTIINGWDIKGYNQAQGVSDGNGGIKVTRNIRAWSYERVYEVLRGTKAGNFTIDKNVTMNIVYGGGGGRRLGDIIRISEGASAANITNNGIINHDSGGVNLIILADGASVDAIVNNGTITSTTTDVLKLEANSNLKKIVNTKLMSATGNDLIRLSGGNNSIDKIELLSGSTTSARTNIVNAQSSATIGTITADNATINGSINLAGTSAITNGISFDNQSKMTGGITLGGSSNIAGISLANASTITGGVTLNGSSSIDNISISGTNTTLAGGISLSNTSAITDIDVGGTITNNISAVGGARIDSINITDGRVGGNISANWSSAGNGIGRINQITITGGEVGGNIALANETSIANGMTLNNGTINGAINLNIGTTDGSVASIPTISLQNASTITNITLGHSAANSSQGRIDSLTLGGTSSIGSIVNNRGTISNIALNGTSTITNGITNAANGNIGTIINDTSNTTQVSNAGTIGAISINQGEIDYSGDGIITEELVVEDGATLSIDNGNGIITMDSDFGSKLNLKEGSTFNGAIKNIGFVDTLEVTGNISGGITNEATIGSLIVNENITYNENNGSIANSLKVAKDKTLTAGNGITLEYESTTFARADVIPEDEPFYNAGTIIGDIENTSNSILPSFTNSGSIEGTFTNNGHIIQFINESTGVIDSFVNNKTIAFFKNEGNIKDFKGNGIIYGVINSNVITGDFNEVSTSLWNEKGAIITGNVTLKGTKQDCGDDSICQQSELRNDGEIQGNVINEANKQIDWLKNTGSIGGSIANSGSIVALEVSGDIAGGIANNGGIGALRVNENLTYRGNGNITNALIVAEGKTLSANSGITFDSADGAISNLGTIEGNLSNVSKSTLDTFNNSGKFNGDITNNTDSTITNFTNSGTTSQINGDITNSGLITRLENQGTISGTITNDADSTITSFTNNGTITGDLYNDGHIDTLTNAGTMGTIYNRSKNTIKNQVNNAGAVIAEIDNSNGRYDTLQNYGTITGNINNNNGIITNLVNANSGTIGGNIDNSNGIIENFENSGTIAGNITNSLGNITIDNKESGFIGEIITSNGGITNISNSANGNIKVITNNANSTTNIQSWNVGDASNPNNPIKVAGDNLGGINTSAIYINAIAGREYTISDIVEGSNGNFDSSGNSYASQLNGGKGESSIVDSLRGVADIYSFTHVGKDKYSVGLDTRELSGKTLGASLIYSSRMRQINTNSMLREINVKNFKTDFEILEQRERLKNQQALLENYKQQRESYLNGLTKDNKELKRVSSKESTSLSTYANNSNIKSDAIEVVDYY
ncbi:beta strand repeat-containing protein, partial [Helicobacter pullorum]|uniref:beta strand repeat-containing protein n=1 Tax=Helicobacter pullorum TaxID=35818 RepID=UPI0015CF5D58